jgi:hypothetical protein
METISEVGSVTWSYTKRAFGALKRYAKWSFGTYMGICATIGGAGGRVAVEAWFAAKKQWADRKWFRAVAGFGVSLLGSAGLILAGTVLGALFLTLFILLPLFLAVSLFGFSVEQLAIGLAWLLGSYLLVKGGEKILETHHNDLWTTSLFGWSL